MGKVPPCTEDCGRLEKKYQRGAIGQLEYDQETTPPKASGTWQLVQGLLITVKPHFAFIHIDIHAD
jgi:hypothetical protein